MTAAISSTTVRTHAAQSIETAQQTQNTYIKLRNFVVSINSLISANHVTLCTYGRPRALYERTRFDNIIMQ